LEKEKFMGRYFISTSRRGGPGGLRIADLAVKSSDAVNFGVRAQPRKLCLRTVDIKINHSMYEQ